MLRACVNENGDLYCETCFEIRGVSGRFVTPDFLERIRASLAASRRWADGPATSWRRLSHGDQTRRDRYIKRYQFGTEGPPLEYAALPWQTGTHEGCEPALQCEECKVELYPANHQDRKPVITYYLVGENDPENILLLLALCREAVLEWYPDPDKVVDELAQRSLAVLDSYEDVLDVMEDYVTLVPTFSAKPVVGYGPDDDLLALCYEVFESRPGTIMALDRRLQSAGSDQEELLILREYVLPVPTP